MKKILREFLGSKRLVFGALLAALFIPLFFHGYHFGWLPWVKGGDEPHYLVILNSLISDGDLDVRNQYEAALQGSDDLGRKFAGQAVDRHIRWRGFHESWIDVYEDPERWPKDAKGHPVPLRRPDAPPVPDAIPEYSAHPIGLAFLLAPFLWVFRGTRWVEPLTLFFSFAVVAGTAYLFARLVGRYRKNVTAVHAAVLLMVLATPVWMNARVLFTEPYLMFFGLAAYLSFVEKKEGFWPGIWVGLGGLVKPNFCMMVLPLAFVLWRERKWKDIVLLGVGPGVATGTFLYWNDIQLGSPFKSPEYLWFGDPLRESFYLLFSWNHGLFCFSPIALFAVWGWSRFLREAGSEALLLGSAFILYFVSMACVWTGGWAWSFGPRHIVPVLPFLVVPFIYIWEEYARMRPWVRGLILLGIGVSLFINFFGALDGYWDSNPLTLLAGNIAP